MDLTEARGSVSFESCTFENCRFNAAELDGVDLRDTDLKGARIDLAGAVRLAEQYGAVVEP